MSDICVESPLMTCKEQDENKEEEEGRAERRVLKMTPNDPGVV